MSLGGGYEPPSRYTGPGGGGGEYPGFGIDISGPRGGQIGAGTYYVPNLPDGTWYLYEGQYYRYENDAWWNWRGQRAWLPIWFVQTPFVDTLNIGYFADFGRPLPVFALARDSGANPIAQTAHIEGMGAVFVVCFQAANSTVEIPIMDADLTDVGDASSPVKGYPLIDPLWPPMVTLRYDTAEVEVDNVANFGSADLNWTDVGVGCRPIIDVMNSAFQVNDISFDVTLRLSRDPTPHWNLVVSLTIPPGSAGFVDSLTWHCWLLGGSAPTPSGATTWTVGSAGQVGHYQVRLPFRILNQGQQQFLTSGENAGGVLPGARQNFNRRALHQFYEYVGAANDPTAGAFDGRIVMTNDGLTSGTNLLSTAYPPAVFLYGHDQGNVDPGGTASGWRMSSWGMMFEQDGLAQVNAAVSIQNSNSDEMCSFSRVRRAGSAVWRVEVWNRSNRLNATGSARAPSINRHYVALVFGPDANATSPTASASRFWPTPAAAATMTLSDLRSRGWYLRPFSMKGAYAIIVWTDDGQETGTSLFTITNGPLVQILMVETGSAGAWTINGCHGSMLKEGFGGATYVTLTYCDGFRWLTIVYAGSPSGGGSASQQNAVRNGVAYAMGDSL